MNRVFRGLVLLVAAYVVMPMIYEVIRALLPLIFMLLGVVMVVKVIQGKVGKW